MTKIYMLPGDGWERFDDIPSNEFERFYDLDKREPIWLNLGVSDILLTILLVSSLDCDI